MLTYCGLYTLGETPRQAVTGVAEEVMQGLRRLGAVTGPQRHRGVFVVFDPEAVKRVLDTLAAEAEVDVLLHAFVCGATREDGRIVDVSWQDHAGAHTVGPGLRRCQRRGRSRLLRRRRNALRQRWMVNLGPWARASAAFPRR